MDSQDYVNRKTKYDIDQKGGTNFLHASYYKNIAEAVKKSNNIKNSILKEQVYIQNTESWDQSMKIIVAFLKRYNLFQTLKTIELECNKIPSKTGFSHGYELDNYFDDLISHPRQTKQQEITITQPQPKSTVESAKAMIQNLDIPGRNTSFTSPQKVQPISSNPKPSRPSQPSNYKPITEISTNYSRSSPKNETPQKSTRNNFQNMIVIDEIELEPLDIPDITPKPAKKKEESKQLFGPPPTRSRNIGSIGIPGSPALPKPPFMKSKESKPRKANTIDFSESSDPEPSSIDELQGLIDGTPSTLDSDSIFRRGPVARKKSIDNSYKTTRRYKDGSIVKRGRKDPLERVSRIYTMDSSEASSAYRPSLVESYLKRSTSVETEKRREPERRKPEPQKLAGISQRYLGRQVGENDLEEPSRHHHHSSSRTSSSGSGDGSHHHHHHHHDESRSSHRRY